MSETIIKKEKRKIDFTQGKVLKNLIIFSLPIAFASLLQMLFNAVDVAVVGRFAGNDAQASVGATTSLVHLIVNLFVGISIGANVVMANAYGAKDEDAQQRVTHTAFATSLLSGLLVLLIGLFCSRGLLTIMKTPVEILDKAVLYLQIYFLGAPALMVYNFSASIMRAVGETKKPLRYLIVAGILNVVINIVTVVFFKWHVIGVALGTTVSQYVSALWITVDLSRSKDGSRLSLKKVRLHEKEFVKILRIGVPMGLTSCAFSLSNLFVQSAINTFGPLTIAGNTVATNIETVCDSFTAAAKSGVVTSIGQNMGAKKPERIKRIIGAGSLMCVTCQAVYATIMFAFGRQVCGLLNGDPQVVDWALKRAYMVGCLNVIALPLIIHGGALQGMGYSMFPMMVNLFFTCVVRIIYMLLVYPFLAVKTVTAVYILYPISWFGASLLMLFFCMRCVKKELEKKEGISNSEE